MRVKDIYSGTQGSDPDCLTVFNGMLFFTADDGESGTELWWSDGTLAGTELVDDIYPGALDSSPYELTGLGNILFFTADDGNTGKELWALSANVYLVYLPVVLRD